MTCPASIRSVAVFVCVAALILFSAVGASAAAASEADSSSSASAASPVSCTLEDPECSSAIPEEGGGGQSGRRRPSLNVRPLPRISARDVSVEEFREKYASPPGGALPLVIADLRGFDPSDWTRAKLRELCGDAPLIDPSDKDCDAGDARDRKNEDCHSVMLLHQDKNEIGRAWGGLDTADLGEWGISTWGELMDQQDSDGDASSGDGQRLYMHDASIVDTCPQALDVLPGMPKYFPRDYDIFEDLDHDPSLAKLWPEDGNFWSKLEGHVHFPSIFIGKGGSSGSRLHSDSGLTRAWMLHLSGRKAWRLTSPRDRERLYPAFPWDRPGTEGASIYTVDLFDPDFEKYPLLDGLTVYEVIAEPGDVVFFPEGWPHQVRNPEDTIAISVNFVDNGNLDAVAEFNREDSDDDDVDDDDDFADDDFVDDDFVDDYADYVAKGFVENDYVDNDYISGFAASFFAPLDDPPFPSDAETDFIPFRTFFHQQVVRSMADVPLAAQQFVKEHGADSHRDSHGRTPLHTAADYNFGAVVRYLLDDVGIDPNVLDECGRTALHVVEAKGQNEEVAKMLKERGGESRITDVCRDKPEEKQLQRRRIRAQKLMEIVEGKDLVSAYNRRKKGKRRREII